MTNQTRRAPEAAKSFIFAILGLVLCYGLGIYTISPIASAVIAIVFGVGGLIIFNAWRAKRELRDAAFQIWSDRVRANLAQKYENPPNIDTPRWRKLFKKGYSPQRAVSHYVAGMMNGQ